MAELPLTRAQRLAFLRRAQVWQPMPTETLDLRAGPSGPDAFQPDELIACDFVAKKMNGHSPKFSCETPERRTLKIRYGDTNGEVEGSVLASRLLWALGFGADRVYPVRIVCRGCSPDPQHQRKKVAGTQTFDLAVVEEKPAGHEMSSEVEGSGWAWPELALVDEAAGGAPRAHRDALTLLAIFMQHTDSKSEQQRLMCLPGGMTADGFCAKPFLVLHDVGLTFGHGNFSNDNDKGSVNFVEWKRAPLWRDSQGCVGHLTRSHTGTLGDPVISEEGRAFLSDLLARLSDNQLHDLFEVARVARRSREPDSVNAVASASVDEWVALFKAKRSEIALRRCG